MDDIISRRAAIDAFEEPQKVQDTWMDEYTIGKRIQWESDVKALNSLPTIDPVKHGQWLPHPTEPDWDVCSVCGIGTHRRFHGYDNGGFWDSEESFQYCPWCGAKLDGGEENG